MLLSMCLVQTTYCNISTFSVLATRMLKRYFIQFVWWGVTRYRSLKCLKLLLYLGVQTKNWLDSGPERNLASALLLSKWQHMISGTNSLSSILNLVNGRKISVQSCTHRSGNNANLIEDIYYSNIKWTLEDVVVTVGSIRFQEVCVYGSYTCNVNYLRCSKVRAYSLGLEARS